MHARIFSQPLLPLPPSRKSKKKIQRRKKRSCFHQWSFNIPSASVSIYFSIAFAFAVAPVFQLIFKNRFRCHFHQLSAASVASASASKSLSAIPLINVEAADLANHTHFPLRVPDLKASSIKLMVLNCNKARYTAKGATNLSKEKALRTYRRDGWTDGRMDRQWAVSHTKRFSDLSTWFFGDTYEYFRRFSVFIFSKNI